MAATTGPSPARKVCTWVWFTLNGLVTVTSGATASVEPLTATLPVAPFSVHSGAVPFGGATVGHPPAGTAVTGSRGRVNGSVKGLGDTDVFVAAGGLDEELQAVSIVRIDTAQATNVTVLGPGENFTVATVPTR